MQTIQVPSEPVSQPLPAISLFDFVLSLDADIARLERWLAACRLHNQHEQADRLAAELKATRDIRARAGRIS